MIHEAWKPVEGYESLYEVSNKGRVFGIKSHTFLRPRKLPNGYLRVNLCKNGVHKDEYIHRLVARAFCTAADGCCVVNHLDNDPTNNSSDNLEWVTQRVNVIYAMNQGRVARFPNAKRVIGIKGGKEYSFHSSHEAAQFANCDHKTVLRACHTGRMTKNGYIWKVV